MALWLVRAGKYGEREDFALQNNLALIGWEELPDLSYIKVRKELTTLLKKSYPDLNPKTLMNWESQIWPFVKEISVGDLIALPLKHRAVIAIGEFTGDYCFIGDNPINARHVRPVKWLNEFPRNQFGQDLLYSLGAAMTVCRIRRNNAESRVRNILAGKKDIQTTISDSSIAVESESLVDLEEIARDQITSYINRELKGHGLARLVGAILQAQGYQVRVSPEGPDGGVDIIAGRGTLGFESPRLVVQVKSSDTPIDVGVLRELQGVISSFGAELGLIVAWGGYRGTVEKEAARQFFKIRLWDAKDLVLNLQENYERLPENIQAELPLKRIWALVKEEE
jgi:restriction system protein